jgi:hypothetical protein
MPGCAYNMFYRHKDPRFAGALGDAAIWGKNPEPRTQNAAGTDPV